ncbi:MAG TPA: Gfo/Idh/MocA family oxidoreductase [Planctomycetaceae bacterium]|nr:Gfo/Idh/MocA family oxidoreductase [Planctomycetaceae bacterium]
MDRLHTPDDRGGSTRREFLQHSAIALAGGSLAAGAAAVAHGAYAGGSDTIRIGLVGCGGRGAGAAREALKADPNARLVAVAEAFQDRLELGLGALRRDEDVGERVTVEPEREFVGFDAYRQVIESDVDVVLLATPPQFRPLHLRASIEAGKHVFAEKPVAVDAPGVRSVLETTELAKRKGLCIVSGLNSRYSHTLLELIRRIHEGAIGEITALSAVRHAAGVWVRPREPGMTEMEYQMRNWYYFTWLSGDFNVEQFVHQYDQLAWALGDGYPERCYSTGGRQTRTGPEYGHIFDHFSSVFEYAGGARAFATTRHQPGCSNESDVLVMGTKGTATLSRGNPGITGENPWRAPRREREDSHQLEQIAFFEALRAGRVINNGAYMANSTLMAILARETAYTGQSITWEQMLQSQRSLAPSAWAWDAEPPAAEVAVPGVTKFV